MLRQRLARRPLSAQRWSRDRLAPASDRLSWLPCQDVCTGKLLVWVWKKKKKKTYISMEETHTLDSERPKLEWNHQPRVNEAMVLQLFVVLEAQLKLRRSSVK